MQSPDLCSPSWRGLCLSRGAHVRYGIVTRYEYDLKTCGVSWCHCLASTTGSTGNTSYNRGPMHSDARDLVTQLSAELENFEEIVTYLIPKPGDVPRLDGIDVCTRLRAEEHQGGPDRAE